MMTKDQFGDLFRQLVEAFSISKPEEKARIYYSKLQNIEENDFEKIVDVCLRNCRSFPTIAEIMEIRARQPSNTKPKEYTVADPVSEQELAMLCAREPDKAYKGILWICGGDVSAKSISKKPIPLQRIIRMTQEIIGEKWCKILEDEYKEKSESFSLTMPIDSL